MENLNYEKVLEKIIKKTEDYIVSNRVKCMVLGVSGGIDSTLCAAICKEVSNNTGIPLIGRSLKIVNLNNECKLAQEVGDTFCNNFKSINLWKAYSSVSGEFENNEGNGTSISEGNIMARLRMMYLYNIAGIKKGIVIDTDNLTEHYLGFWTLHGDEGDFNPIGGLWKTEVYELSKYVAKRYNEWSYVMNKSIAAIPTDGNGISSSDLDQIGGKDYYEVDKILIPFVKGIKAEDEIINDLINSGFNEEVIKKILERYKNSEFKRKTSRVIKISRDELL